MAAETLSSELLEHGYGWRARIGFLRPGIVDESLACQFYQMAPRGVTIVQTTLGVTALTTDEITSALDRAKEAAQLLAQRHPDCIILGGSPTVVIGGYDSEEDLRRSVEQASGIQTATAQTAAVEALRSLKISRLVVATPFPEPFPSMLKAYLERSGFSVLAIDSLDVDYRELTKVPLKFGYELAKRLFRATDGAEGIYFPGAPFPVAGIIESLEQELNTTVVSSMQASLWKGLLMSGVTGVQVDGFGRLLRENL